MNVNSSDPIKSRKIKHLTYTLCSIFLILSPWILLFVSALLAKGTIATNHPVWSDELGYWHEILSLSMKGLNFGYYTINEEIPQYLSFGTHGFGIISAYVPFAKVFGWNLNSMVLANNFYISIAFLLLVVMIRPSIKTLLLTAFFYLTYMPLIFYNFTSMAELINYAFLIIYFVLFYSYMKTERYRKALFIILLIFTLYISFTRIIYIVLILPVLLEHFKVTGFNKGFLKVLAIWVPLSALLYLINSLFVAPFPYSFLNELFATTSISEFLYVFQKHFFNNIVNFVHFGRDTALQVFQRYFVLIFVVLFTWKSDVIKYKFKKWDFPFFVCSFILILTLLINFAAYDVFSWRDFRVIAPILFSTIVFITFAGNTSFIKGALSINIIILIIFIAVMPSSYRKNEVFTKDRYQKIEDNAILKSIEYKPSVNSPFENTIAIEGFYPEIHLNIPAGIGISACFHGISDSLRSHYLYTVEPYDLKTYRLIKSSEKGFLYEKIKDE